MIKIVPHFHKFQIAGKLLTSSILVSSLIGINTSVLAQPTTAPTSSPSTLNQSTDPIIQKLWGQWEAINVPSKSPKFNFIFTPEGKLLLISYDTSNPSAIAFKYSIDSKPKPQHLDVTIAKEPKPVQTIFEFTTDGQLRVQLENTAPGNSRPTAFAANATLFKKVSDSTALPDKVELFDPFSQSNPIKELQAEGKNYIGSMNRGQQAYYLEFGKFAKTLDQLQLGIKSETDSYSYQILPQRPATKSIIHTATAKKPGLKSYTAIVFVKKDGSAKETVTYAEICETDKPTTKAPVVKKFPTQKSPVFQCPPGSHSLAP